MIIDFSFNFPPIVKIKQRLKKTTNTIILSTVIVFTAILLTSLFIHTCMISKVDKNINNEIYVYGKRVIFEDNDLNKPKYVGIYTKNPLEMNDEGLISKYGEWYMPEKLFKQQGNIRTKYIVHHNLSTSDRGNSFSYNLLICAFLIYTLISAIIVFIFFT